MREALKVAVKGLRIAWDWLQQEIPAWLKLVAQAIGRIIFALLKEAGQNYISSIEDKIIATSQEYKEATGEEKFNIVWEFASQLLPKGWSESEIDTLIQSLFINLKNLGRV